MQRHGKLPSGGTTRRLLGNPRRAISDSPIRQQYPNRGNPNPSVALVHGALRNVYLHGLHGLPLAEWIGQADSDGL